MDQELVKNILNSIKTDNLILFSSFIKNNENLSLGRFPILSICYLYNARKIIFKFEKMLISVDKFHIVNEPFEIYRQFTTVANRTLRIYSGTNTLISPIEMLAILHSDNKVKKFYKLYKSNNLLTENIMNNLETIYNIYNQNPLVLSAQIIITPRPLTKKQKKAFTFNIILSIVFILIFSSFYTMLNFTTGFGTSFNPYRIYTQNQLLKAISSDGYYSLSSDITIDEIPSNLSFSGTFDGNNHTLYISSIPTTSLIDSNTGTIKNLNIVYTTLENEIADNLCLFINNNEGTLENINISCDNLNLSCSQTGNKDINISAFTINNSGNINNCNLSISSSLKKSNSRECTFSGFATKNTGKITNCIVKDGNIITNEIDIAGIVINNEVNGEIKNCKNNATLSQDSEINGWSPTLAGIALNNYGIIENTYNNGNLTINSANVEENIQGNVFLGGIVSMNYGNLNKCLNNGNLVVHSEKLIVYVGGISAYSSYRIENQTTLLPLITNCGSNSNLDITTNNENVYAFTGGICGFLYGNIKNCYSISTFTNEYTDGKYFSGTIIGSAYLQYNFWNNYICLEANNNYILTQENVYYQIGSLINNGSIVSAGLDIMQGITKLSTLEEIKQLEVYWE